MSELEHRDNSRNFSNSIKAESVNVKITGFDLDELIQKLHRLSNINKLSIQFEDYSNIPETSLTCLAKCMQDHHHPIDKLSLTIGQHCQLNLFKFARDLRVLSVCVKKIKLNIKSNCILSHQENSDDSNASKKISILGRLGKSFGAIKDKIIGGGDNIVMERILKNISIQIDRDNIIDERTTQELFKEITKSGRNNLKKLKIIIASNLIRNNQLQECHSDENLEIIFDLSQMLKGIGSTTLRKIDLQLNERIRINEDAGKLLITSISTMTTLKTLKLSIQDYKLSLNMLIDLFETINNLVLLEVAVISVNRIFNTQIFPLFCSNLRQQCEYILNGQYLNRLYDENGVLRELAFTVSESFNPVKNSRDVSTNRNYELIEHQQKVLNTLKTLHSLNLTLKITSSSSLASKILTALIQLARRSSDPYEQLQLLEKDQFSKQTFEVFESAMKAMSELKCLSFEVTDCVEVKQANNNKNQQDQQNYLGSSSAIHLTKIAAGSSTSSLFLNNLESLSIKSSSFLDLLQLFRLQTHNSSLHTLEIIAKPLFTFSQSQSKEFKRTSVEQISPFNYKELYYHLDSLKQLKHLTLQISEYSIDYSSWKHLQKNLMLTQTLETLNLSIRLNQTEENSDQDNDLDIQDKQEENDNEEKDIQLLLKNNCLQKLTLFLTDDTIQSRRQFQDNNIHLFISNPQNTISELYITIDCGDTIENALCFFSAVFFLRSLEILSVQFIQNQMGENNQQKINRSIFNKDFFNKINTLSHLRALSLNIGTISLQGIQENPIQLAELKNLSVLELSRDYLSPLFTRFLKKRAKRLLSIKII